MADIAYWRKALVDRQLFPLINHSNGGDPYGQEGQGKEVLKHIRAICPPIGRPLEYNSIKCREIAG